MSSRSSRIIVLTFTAVLAVAVFAGIWTFRPGQEENEILKAARERQTKSLIEIREPLETDVKKLSEDEKMAQRVKELLLSDADFTAAVTDNVVTNDAFSEAIEPIVKQRVDYYAELYRPELIALIEKESEVNREELVDSLIGPVSEKVYSEFEARVGADADAIAELVLERLEEEVANYVTKEVITPIVHDIIDDSREDLILETVERVLEALDKEAEKAEKTQVITAPKFSEVKTVESESDYITRRKQEREAAIQEALKKLKGE